MWAYIVVTPGPGSSFGITRNVEIKIVAVTQPRRQFSIHIIQLKRARICLVHRVASLR